MKDNIPDWLKEAAEDKYPDLKLTATQSYHVEKLRDSFIVGITSPEALRYHQSADDRFKFAEWACISYVRLHGCWVHKYADQTNMDNWRTTEELYKQFTGLPDESHSGE